MRLKTLELYNFRQFRGGGQKIHFATDPQCPVTLILGDNNGGKTTLLNALTWCLYGTTTRKFLQPEALINSHVLHAASSGTIVEAWVRVQFEHQNKVYIVERKVQQMAGATRHDEPVLSVYENHQQVGRNPQAVIYDILPQELVNYFFFDGESEINEILNPTQAGRANLARATQALLGIDPLHKAIEELSKAENYFRRKCKGQSELDNCQNELAKAEELREACQKRLHDCEESLNGFIRELQHLEQQFQRCEGLVEINKQLQKARLECDRYQRERTELERRIHERIARQGYHCFLNKAAEAVRHLIDRMRQRGNLPSDIKPSFVAELLRSKKCICGTSLEEGSPARQCLENWQRQAGLDIDEARLLRLEGRIGGLAQEISHFWKESDADVRRRCELDKAIQQLEAHCTHLERQQGEGSMDLTSLAQRREDARQQQIRAQIELQKAQQALREAEAACAEAKKRLDSAQVKDVRLRCFQQRTKLAQQAKELLEKARDIWKKALHTELEIETRKQFSDTTPSQYIPHLDEHYRPELKDAAGRICSSGTGETTVLALAYLCAIVALRRHQQRRHDPLCHQRDIRLPVVLDAPFGQLGREFREATARHLVGAIEQPVFLLLNEQWEGAVERALSDSVGACYRLLNHVRIDETKPVPIVHFRGRSYELWAKDNASDENYTTIERIDIVP